MTWLSRAIDCFDEGNHRDGDLLSHDWMKWALDVRDPKSIEEARECQFLMMQRCEEFREYLLTERKIALENVRGKGYRIVPPNDQARYAAQETMDSVRKSIAKGDKIFTNTRLDQLNAEERKRHTDAHLKVCGIRDMIGRSRKDLFKLFAAE